MYTKTLAMKYKRSGWGFVLPAAALIFILNFYPMVQAFFLSLQSGLGNNLHFSGLRNYIRLFQDEMFLIFYFSSTRHAFFGIDFGFVA